MTIIISTSECREITVDHRSGLGGVRENSAKGLQRVRDVCFFGCSEATMVEGEQGGVLLLCELRTTLHDHLQDLLQTTTKTVKQLSEQHGH